MNKQKSQTRVGIIGGGAAGLMTAVLLARQGIAVTILEKNDKIGKKLLVTGNGRCNLSNRQAQAKNYFSRSQNLAPDILNRFPVEAALETFASMGIAVKELDKGKLYPYSLEAKTVVKAFLYELAYLGVTLIYQANVTKIQRQDSGQWLVSYDQKKENPGPQQASPHRKKPKLVTYDRKQVSFSHLVLASGGMSYGVSGSDGSGYDLAKQVGHSLIQPIPAIVQLVMDDKQFPHYKHLQGTKTQAHIKLYAKDQVLREEEGEVLFTAYGLSGPPILLLSTGVAYGQGQPLSLSLNFFPEMTEPVLARFLDEKIGAVPYYSLEHLLEMFLPNRLVGVLLKECQLEKDQAVGRLTGGAKEKILNFLSKLELKIDKPYQWQQAQVTAGGISCREVDPHRLESKKSRGLYFVGEVLDIDGDCGGFNLQWAWSSAMAVAEAIGKGKGNYEV